MSTSVIGVRVEDARGVAAALLDGMTDRLRHPAAVAAEAREVASIVDPADRDVLVSAAWLHDIGYSPAVRDTGHHPLDGARFLAARGWPARLCALVAHHSGSHHVAAA